MFFVLKAMPKIAMIYNGMQRLKHYIQNFVQLLKLLNKNNLLNLSTSKRSVQTTWALYANRVKQILPLVHQRNMTSNCSLQSFLMQQKFKSHTSFIFFDRILIMTANNANMDSGMICRTWREKGRKHFLFR